MSDQSVALLREFGFPVVVAVWFMWRLEKRLDRLFELFSALLKAVALLAKSVDYGLDEAREARVIKALEDDQE